LSARLRRFLITRMVRFTVLDFVDPVPQIFLLTDGEVSNTDAVVAAVKGQFEITGARVFTFGIGRDVSHALVEGAATAGERCSWVGVCSCHCSWVCAFVIVFVCGCRAKPDGRY
jgi:hypothetical protein